MKRFWLAGLGLALAGVFVAWRGCAVGDDDLGSSGGDPGKKVVGAPQGSTAPNGNASSDIGNRGPTCDIQTAPLNDGTLHCPEKGGFAKCGAGMKCCPAGANACVPTSEMCSTSKVGFECFSSSQCKSAGSVCCAFAQKTASMFQPCTKPQLTFDASESSSCTTLAECPKSNARRVRLCPNLGTSEGCDPSETCKERFTYLQGLLMTIYVCE